MRTTIILRLILCCGLSGVAVGQDWMTAAGAPLTDDEVLSEMARVGTSGLFLSDSAQQFANVISNINAAQANGNPYANRANHSGFSALILEPGAWLSRQRSAAEKKFLGYTIQDVTPQDRLNILRVVIFADMPQFLNGHPGNSVSHVVLRSTDRRVVAQPIYVEPFGQSAQNMFGASLSRGGEIAFFKMNALNIVRQGDPNREFFVTIVGEGRTGVGSYYRDFRVKRKHFAAMGD